MTTSLVLSLPAELLLLVLDDDGNLRVDSTKRKAAVAGAAVLQLVLDGVLDLEPGEPGRARLVARPGAATLQSAVLEQAKERAVGHTPKDAVARIGGASDWKGRAKDIQESVLDELAAAGVLDRFQHRHLGLFTSTSWPLRRPEVRSDIQARIDTALDGGPPDAQAAALVGILNAIDLLPKLFPRRDKKAMRRVAEQIGELGWAGEAVAQAISQVQAAVIASVVVSTTAANS
ncbi:GPP34 family phosphoprotein [Humibacillus xanthopallidus]|uniref:GOLPH3/VPS74 family protein n=1 Tax=Humibacillus xanthopallidus TaxID=412689 RepID=UPI00384D8AD2